MTQLMFVFSAFPTLASGASIARGRPLREIGQKPEPAISRRNDFKKASLREGGGPR